MTVRTTPLRDARPIGRHEPTVSTHTIQMTDNDDLSTIADLLADEHV